MKTRIIQTSFWKDCKVQEMSLYAQHLFIYLLTSDHIGLTGAFELPDSYILLESKLTEHQLNQAKEELTKTNRVVFSGGWVVIRNAGKYNNYLNSPKTIKAYEREYQCIPSKLLVHLDSSIDSSIDTIPIVTIKQKTKTINHKTEYKKNVIEIAKMIGEAPTDGLDRYLNEIYSQYVFKQTTIDFIQWCQGKKLKPTIARWMSWVRRGYKTGDLNKRSDQ